MNEEKKLYEKDPHLKEYKAFSPQDLRKHMMEEKQLLHAKKASQGDNKGSIAGRKEISKEINAFEKGKLHFRNAKTGPLVKSLNQAEAIGYSMARAKGYKV